MMLSLSIQHGSQDDHPPNHVFIANGTKELMGLASFLAMRHDATYITPILICVSQWDLGKDVYSWCNNRRGSYLL